MAFTEFFHDLAHLFQASFRMMKSVNSNVNVLFIIIGAIGLIGWLWKQMQYNREAEEQRTWK